MTSLVYECHSLAFYRSATFHIFVPFILKIQEVLLKIKVITLQRGKYTTVSNVVLPANHDTKFQNSIPHEIRHSLPVPALT